MHMLHPFSPHPQRTSVSVLFNVLPVSIWIIVLYTYMAGGFFDKVGEKRRGEERIGGCVM